MSLVSLFKSTALPTYRNQIDTNNIKVLNPETVSVAMLQGEFDAKAQVQVGDVVKVGQLVGLKDLASGYFPIYSPVSGEVTSIVKKMSTKLKPCEYVVIKNDLKNEMQPLEQPVSLESAKEEIVEFIKKMGLLESKALAYQKYNTANETLVVSLVEEGPYLVSDVKLAKDNKDALGLGIALVKKVCGANKVIVVSSSDDSFKEELADVENKVLEATYPLNDREVILKALNLSEALVVEGSSLVRLGLSVTTGLPVHNVYVTVAGDSIEHPSVVSCPMGTALGELLNACGCKEGTHNLTIGNPLTGTVVTSSDVAVSQLVNEITVFPFDGDQDFTCIRCGRCADVCPKGLLPMEIVTALKKNDIETLGKLDVNACSECGLCAYECPSDIEVTESVRRAKRIYNLRRKK